MHAYHQVFFVVGLVDLVALLLAVYIVYVLLKLNKLIGVKGLLLITIGYIVFSLGLCLSIASSLLVVFYGPSEPKGPPELVLGARRGLLPGENLALRIGFTAWSIIGYSSIVYSISYLLILAGLLTSRYRVVEAGLEQEGKDERLSLMFLSAPIPVLEAAQPLLHASYLLLLGDGLSLVLLAGIVFLHCGYLRGRMGYLLLLASHVLRLLAVLLASPWILVVAELVRPFGLILIATALAGAIRR